MAAKAAGPGGGGNGDAAAWVLPVVATLVVIAGCAIEVGGALASLIDGPGWRTAPMSIASAKTLLSKGTRAFWPGTPPVFVAATAALVALIVLGPVAFFAIRMYLRRPAHDDPHRSLARYRDVVNLASVKASQRAQRLRPSLAGTAPKGVAPTDIGFVLGDLAPAHKTCLYGSWEDVAVAFMAPRSMKTTALAIPLVLDAPGAAIATANKADLWAATAQLRAASTGERVWTFDPQRIARADQTWWWDPLGSLTGAQNPLEEAERLAGHFVLTVEDSRSRDIWGPAATELLAALFLAAAVSGRSLLEAYRWLSNESDSAPVQALRVHGWDTVAFSLAGVQDAPPETRGSVFFTARTAAKCLRNPQITAWITPPGTGRFLDEFRPDIFPSTRETLYLLSKDGGGSAAPLVAALTDAVMRGGVRAAERRGGRLDPPLLVVLDEAANICKISDLPRLYSHLGSRGIVVLTILQSYNQGVGVWGDTGMKELWSAATIKLIGAGIDDPDFAEDISRLVGDHDVATVSHHSGGERSTQTHASRQQRILPTSAVRALTTGTALLFATGTKVAIVRLRPWFQGPRSTEIAAAVNAATLAVTAAALAGDPVEELVQ